MNRLISFLLSFWFIIFPAQKVPTTNNSPFETNFAYEKNLFISAIGSLPKDDVATNVVVVPHHLTSSDLIAKGINMISKKNPDTIILISPNHADVGNCEIITSDRNWSTQYGIIEVNKSLQENLFKSNTFCFDDSHLENEHGIAGLLPFIKYLSPKARIVPFALKKYLDYQNLDIFIKSLENINSNKIAFVSSIDFSHNQTKNISLEKDKIIQKLIFQNDFSEIEKLKQDHVDSPASLIVAMKLANTFKMPLTAVLHKDSSMYNNSTTSVTSYFLLASSVVKPVSLIFGGDVMLGRTVNNQIKKYQDTSWPFKNISEVLMSADISLINLESPFKSGCLPTDTGMNLCADPESVKGLVSSGIDIVNLANNHIQDQGSTGYQETLSVLDLAKISVVGLGIPVYKEINGLKLSFLGFNDIGNYQGVSNTQESSLVNQIQEAKKNSKFLVVTFHWGEEYQQRTARQQFLAHLAIDNGADLIIGHHPHWIQDHETYKDKLIYYSLGNLVFDQEWSEETKQGLLLKLIINSNQILSTEEIKVSINDYGQPSISN